MYPFLGNDVPRIMNSAASKYPPAKPGALDQWPLEAAVRVANATHGVVSRSKRLNGVADAAPRVHSATEVAG